MADEKMERHEQTGMPAKAGILKRMSTLLKRNRLLAIVLLVYAVLFAAMPEKAASAASNSVYYLLEMVQVLPVIFLLTVVIDALVPREWILRHFGEKAGWRGSLFSLLLGSISAGPIYAAFPVCRMLLNKGASVANIVIVLSAWAVIKFPMLANEAKFLGVSFMGLRWVLTVAAILLMSWAAGRLIRREELVRKA